MNGSKSRELRKLTKATWSPRAMFHGPTGGFVADPDRRTYQHAKKQGKGVSPVKAVKAARAEIAAQSISGAVVKRRHVQANNVNRSVLKSRQEAARKKQQRNDAEQVVPPKTDKKPFMSRAKKFLGSMLGRRKG